MLWMDLETQCMFPFSYTEQALPLATWPSLETACVEKPRR